MTRGSLPFPIPMCESLSVTDLARLLRGASRTFALGIERLPSGLLEEVRTAYLLLRVSDYLEDNEEMTPQAKADLLERWTQVLDGNGDATEFERSLPPILAKTPDAEVARHLGAVFSAYQALPLYPRAVLCQHVGDTNRGMARWALRGSHFETEADLDDYMHEVAGRVGLLLTDLFALRSPQVRANQAMMLEAGREFGLGLQTVNVIRGLHEDRHRGWVFVPKSFLPSGIEAPEQLFEAGREADALFVLDKLTSKAERHLGTALSYVERLPRRMRGARIFCILPLFFALRTLAVSRANPRVFEQEVKMPRSEVVTLTGRSELLWWSNRWLRATAQRLAAG